MSLTNDDFEKPREFPVPGIQVAASVTPRCVLEHKELAREEYNFEFVSRDSGLGTNQECMDGYHRAKAAHAR